MLPTSQPPCQIAPRVDHLEDFVHGYGHDSIAQQSIHPIKGSAKIAWLLYVIPAGSFSCFSGCHSGQRCPNFCVCGQVQLVGFGEGADFHYLHALFFVLFRLGNKKCNKLQNLDPESPLMEKQNLCAAPSMIQKPCFTYTHLYGIGCGMPLGSTSWMPVWPELMIWRTTTFMSWLMLAATLFMWELLMTQKVIQLLVDCKCLWDTLKLP